MLRFVLVPAVVIQLFMMLGLPASGVREGWDPNGVEASARPGWDPNGGSDIGPGWDPDGANNDSGNPSSDIGLGWDPNG